MRRNILTRICLGAILIAPSCNKEMQEAGNYVPLTLSVCDENSVPEDKTIIGTNDGENAGVVFTSADKLFVFGEKDGDIRGTQFKPKGQGRKSPYDFTTESWPEGYTPIYAVTSTTTDTRQTCTSDGKVTLLVNNAAQKINWSKSYASNTTAHIGAVEDVSSVRLKNICGLLEFRVTNDDITRIVVTGNNGEFLGGWINVDYGMMSEEPIDFFTPTADAVKKLELTVAATLDNGAITTNGCFPAGDDNPFFISILPGAYTSGLTFKMYNSNGEMATRTIASALPIERGEIRKFKKAIDDGLEFKVPELPETLTFSIVKGHWPFVEKIVPTSSQKEDGDEYTYNYPLDDDYSWPFKFRIHDSEEGYITSSDDILRFFGAAGYLQFPAIEGRVLQSVTLQVRNAAGKNFAISKTTTGRELADGLVPTTGITTTWYSDGVVKTMPNTSYYLRVIQSGSYYTKIEAVYVKELTPTPIVVPEEFTAVLDFSEAWPFENAIAAKASQAEAGDSYDGEIYDFKYSETATLKFAICQGKVNYYVYTKPSGTTPGCLNFARIGTTGAYEDNEGFVKLPAIPGRYVKEVKVTSQVANHTIYICKSNQRATSGNNLLKPFSVTQNTESSSGELDAETNTPYYLFRNGSSAEKYTTIAVTYSTKE